MLIVYSLILTRNKLTHSDFYIIMVNDINECINIINYNNTIFFKQTSVISTDKQ